MGIVEKPASVCVENVSKSFDKRQVLFDISFQVQKAEIFGLLGPSGSGKTTLVKILSGIHTASSGSVQVLGDWMPNLATMQHIGFMAQSDALYGELNAHENLEFFAKIYGLKGAARKNRINHVLELVRLSDDRKKAVHQFSGGMKRRLSLAASLLHQPSILILDEPTVGIDPLLRRSIWKELEHLAMQGTTIIVTTHVMDEATKCHQLGMIREGKLIAKGSPAELMQQTSTQTIEEAFLYFGGMQS